MLACSTWNKLPKRNNLTKHFKEYPRLCFLSVKVSDRFEVYVGLGVQVLLRHCRGTGLRAYDSYTPKPRYMLQAPGFGGGLHRLRIKCL